MRMLFIGICLILSLAQCQAQQEQKQAKSMEYLRELQWQLRDVLRMQLPLTITEDRNGKPTGKSYSFDFAKADSLVWEIPEKYHDPETMEIYGGGKYFIPFSNLDPSSISLEKDSESGNLSIVLKAKKGASFTFHPYSNDPDQSITEIRLGWWEPLQEYTLKRALKWFEALVE
ncbi:MAG: hypothetical protein Kow0027_17730 [Saprospiraceae bacterium]